MWCLSHIRTRKNERSVSWIMWYLHVVCDICCEVTYNFFLPSIIQRRVQKYSLYSDQKLFHLKENGTYNFSSSHTLHTDFQVMKWDQEITSGFSICQWHTFCKFIQNFREREKKSTMNSPRKTTYHCQFFFSIRFSYLWSTYYLFKYVQHCSNGKTRPQHITVLQII